MKTLVSFGEQIRAPLSSYLPEGATLVSRSESIDPRQFDVDGSPKPAYAGTRKALLGQ